MPDVLPTFTPGDPATKALNAGFLNALVNRVNLGALRPKPTKKRDPVVSTVECLVVNNTSGVFPERSVVACTSKGLNLSTDSEKVEFQAEPVLQIDTPAASTDFPIICIEPIPPNGGVGRVAIGGIAVCTVNVTDAGHDYANPTPGDETRLTSGATGQVRILWKDTGTGNKTAVVYLVESAGSGGGTCIDVDTFDTFTITIPPQVIGWTGSIGPPPTCTLTLTPTYGDETVITYEVRLAGNTCDELTLTVTEI